MNKTVKKNYVSISGEGGSGKSFLTRIMAKKYYEADIICFVMDLSLVELDEVSNFAQFLLDNSCCSFLNDELILDEVSTWMISNENKVVLVLDGLDQISSLNLTTRFKTSLNKNQSAMHWISAILARKVLSNSKIILTSRPYALSSLHGNFTPTCIYTLHGFCVDSLQSVLDFYLNKTKAKTTFELLKSKRLTKLATNPNSTFLLVKAFEEGFNFDGEDITSTLLYATVFDSMFRTKSFDIENSEEKLTLLEGVCFKLIKNKKFKIEKEDLENTLEFKDIEKLIPVEAKIVENAYNLDRRKIVFKTNHQFALVSLLFKL